MKQIKKILAAILIVIVNISFAQYSELSDQDMILRMWKTYNLTDGAYNSNVLKLWLNIFDKKNYPTYSKNEFTLKDKLDQTKQNLQVRLGNLENTAIYCYYDNRSFGEYDFDKEQYKFKPFTNFSTEKKLTYSWDKEAVYFRTNLKFFGLDFVNGIPMQRNQAEQFLNNRGSQKNIWGQTYNDRNVYLKIFYYTSLEDKVEYTYDYSAHAENRLKCTPILVQAFNEKTYSTFICEWWNPVISDYFKKQMIDNNIPRGFYESLNQPAEQISNSNKYNGPVTILFKKNISTIPEDKIDELNKIVEFLKQNKNYKYKVENFLYAENNDDETKYMIERITNIYEYFKSNNIDNTRRAKIQSNEAYDQFSSNVRKVIVKLIEE